jgi:hypothetical protein
MDLCLLGWALHRRAAPDRRTIGAIAAVRAVTAVDLGASVSSRTPTVRRQAI